ncbi:MAG: hypothetical protein HYX50_02080 [Chloroflexi bacterium]|nr:hypothetical protein [Chloroflexota bacterium]
MPTYEYACTACGKHYDKREGFDAPSKQKCQFCGKPANRVLHAPPVVFKGSGFYKTDSRGSSSSEPRTTPAPAADTTPAADGGHTHGPGGHTHETPAPAPASDTPEAAAAG